jgi:hypothetical protein
MMCMDAIVLAYIGPGADLSLISSVIGLVLTLGASGVFILLYPFRAFLRRIRGGSKPVEHASIEDEPVASTEKKNPAPMKKAA